MGTYADVIDKLISNGVEQEAAIHYVVQTFGASILGGLIKDAKEHDRTFISVSDVQKFQDEMERSNELIIKKRGKK